MKILPLVLSLSMALIAGNAWSSVHHNHSEPVNPKATLPKLESLEKVKPIAFSLPKFERFSTNGTPVIVTSLPQIAMVDISITFHAGSSRDTQIRPDGFGISSLTAQLLEKGTKQLSEEAFVRAKDDLGIRLNASTSKDSLTVHLRSLSDADTLGQAIALTNQMLTTPRFDANVLERTKSQVISGIKQNEQNPNYIASRAYIQALLGNHPYAHPSSGTATSVASISVQDLQKFSQQFLVAKNATITITGDISTSQARAIAEQLSSALPQGTKAPALPAPAKPKAQHIHIPHDSTQTNIIIGHLAPSFGRSESQWRQEAHFGLGNDILASGSFNARLMDHIREQKGYTYGITGRRTTWASAGVYQISFSTAASQSVDAIKDTLKVVQKTVDDGVSEDEFLLFQDQQKHQYPMSFASNAAIHNITSIINVQNLPQEAISGHLGRVSQATLNDVNQALKQVIHPQDFIIITVGKHKPDLSQIIKP